MVIPGRPAIIGIAAWTGLVFSGESVQYNWGFSEGNLVGNWSFESESEETCSPLNLPSGVVVDCSAKDQGAVSGDHALSITIPAATLASPAAAQKTDFLRVEPGSTYTLSFNYGILFGSVSQFRPQVEIFDEAKNLLSATCPAGDPVSTCADLDYYPNVPIANLGTWMPYRATFSVPVNASFVRVSLLTYKIATTILAGMKFDNLMLNPGNAPSPVKESKAYGDATATVERIVSSDANQAVAAYVVYDSQRRPWKQYLPLVFAGHGGLGGDSPIVVGIPEPGEALIYGYASLEEAYSALKSWAATRSLSEIGSPVINMVVDADPGEAFLGIPPLEFGPLLDKNGGVAGYEIQGVIRGTAEYVDLAEDQVLHPPVPVTVADIPVDPSTLDDEYAAQFPGESNFFSENRYFDGDTDIHTFSIERSGPGSVYAMGGGHTEKSGWTFSGSPAMPGGSPEMAVESFPVETEVGYIYNWSRDRQGNYSGFKFNNEGNLLVSANKVGSGWRISEYEYDSFNRRTNSISPMAHEIVTSEFDGQSHAIAVDDPDRGFSRYRYNERGWLRYEVPDNGDALPENIKMLAYKYDALGRAIESGVTAYDENQENVENSSGFPAAHLEHGAIYDELSAADWLSRTGVTLSTVGIQVSSLKNLAGRLAAKYYTNPDFNLPGYSADRCLVAAFHSYDSIGRLDTLFRYVGAVGSVSARLQKIAYAFDDLGRLASKKVFANGSSNIVVSGTIFKYDESSRVVKVLDKDGIEIASYAYNTLDQQDGVSLYGKFGVKFGYSMRSNLVKIEASTLGANPKSIFSEYLGYDAKAYDHPSIPEMGEGTGLPTERYTPKRYDGRLTTILKKLSSDVANPISLMDYKYDESGRLLRAQTRTPLTGSNLNTDGSIDFNALSFPVIPPGNFGGPGGVPDIAVSNVGSEGFLYNEDGSIDKRRVYAGFENQIGGLIAEKTYSYKPNTHQLENIRNSDGSAAVREGGALLSAADGNFVFDARGRLIEDKGSGHVFEYGFYSDLPIRIKVTTPGHPTHTSHLLYDESMNRIAVIEEEGGSIQGSKVHVYESGTDIVREYVDRTVAHPMGAVSMVKSSIWGNGGMVGVVDEGTLEKRLFLKDHLGSTVKVLAIDAQGNSEFTGKEEYSYWAYGFPERKVVEENDMNPTGTYTGKEFDRRMALYYFGARFFDPEIGTWLSPDAYGEFFNPYSRSGDPVNFVDPDGNCEFVCISIIVGVVAGSYLGGSAANGTFNPLRWDFRDGNTYLGMGTGALIGAGAGWSIGVGYGLGATTFWGSAAMGAGIGGGLGLASSSYSQVESGHFSEIELIRSSATGAAAGAVAGMVTGYSGNWFTKALLNAGLESGQAGLTGGNPVKAALVGFAAGAFVNSTGPGSNLALRTGKQALATSGTSIGRNWAYNRDLLSKVNIGLGPVNVVVGKDATLTDQWRANRTAVILNGIGLANALLPRGEAQWDGESLSFSYSGGALGIAGVGYTGAGAVFGFGKGGNAYSQLSTYGAHENVHVWDSRSLGFGRFISLWALSGGPIGENYYEERANSYGYGVYP